METRKLLTTSLVVLVQTLALAACRSEPKHGAELSAGEPPAPYGRVVSAGSLTVPRAAHTATALADGTVLIAGGCSEESCEPGEGSTTFEVYDPKAGTLAPGRLAGARIGHTATRLPDGRVLLAGGWSGSSPTAGTEIYDPASRTTRPSSSLGAARGGHTATPLPDGTILFAGGMSGGDGQALLDLAEVYDPKTGTFRSVGRLLAPRSGHVAVVLRDGRVLLAGGDGPGGEVLASAEVYVPEVGRFAEVSAMTVPRHKHAAAPLPDGRVLVVGGSDDRDFQGRYASAELFDPERGEFTRLPDMGSRRFKLADAVVALPGGQVFVGGGGPAAELFDPAAGVFRQVDGSLDSVWSFAAAALLADGSVLVTGGYDDRIRLTAGMWRYQPRP